MDGQIMDNSQSERKGSVRSKVLGCHMAFCMIGTLRWNGPDLNLFLNCCEIFGSEKSGAESTSSLICRGSCPYGSDRFDSVS